MTKKDKVEKVMGEWKAGTLTSHGKKVTNYDQAVAIALSEAGLSKKMKEGGGIGFVPMDLEEELMITAKWGGTNIKGVIGILNAMIDSGLTDDDLKVKPIKNTRFQIERATEKKIQEIWNKIEPNYKGDFKGNMYYSTIKRLVNRSGTDDNILKRYKPFRKYQYAEGGGIEKENALMVANNNKQIAHHTREMESALKDTNYVPAWVVAKVNRSASDLSDATHYLEGQEGKYEKGGNMNKYAKGGAVDAPKIYVADLEAYNNGKLVGEWLDLSDFEDGEEVSKEISKLLKKWGAEEYAIHDVENVPSSIYSEYMGEEDFDKIIKIYKASEENDLPYEVISEIMLQYEPEDLEEWISDYYEGHFDNDTDLAYNVVESIGSVSDLGNKTTEMYFDYDKFGRDLAINDEWEGDFDSDEDRGYDYVENMGGVSELGGRTIDMYFDYEKFGRDLAINDYIEIEDGYYFRTPRYAKGGLTNERRYVNKSQDYEVRYAKNRLKRTGYKNERKFAVGGEIGNTVTFSRYGERTTGRITDKLRNGYEVVTDEGTILVEPQEVISFSETPIAKKKRFGFFEGGGGIENSLNKRYLNGLPEAKKLRILINLSNHYGISLVNAFEEVTDIESEPLYEYITDKSLRMEVYNDMKNRRYAGGGEIENKIEKLKKVVSSKMLPESVKAKAQAEIDKLEKELHESKETKAEEKEEHKAGGKEYKYLVWEDGTHRIISKHPSLSGAEKYAKELADKNKGEIYHFGSTEKYERFKAEEGKSEYESKLDEKEELNSTIQKLYGIESKAEDLINYQDGGIQNQSIDKIKKYVEYINKEVSKLDVPFGSEIYDTLQDENAHSLNLTLGLLGFYKNEKDSGEWARTRTSYKDLVNAVNEVKGIKTEYKVGDPIKKPTTKKAPVKKAPVKKAVVKKAVVKKAVKGDLPKSKFEIGDKIGVSGDNEVYEIKDKSYRNNIEGELTWVYYLPEYSSVLVSEKNLKVIPKPKADHKKLVAKLKAKKGGKEYDNRASLVPFTDKRRERSESSDKKRSALPPGKRVSENGVTYYENRLNRTDLSKEDKFEGGGSVDNRVLVVLDEGNGKVINNLFNQWNNVKTEKQYNSWIENVKKSKFGTYGTISINEVLEKFEFDKSNVNSVKKSDFKKEINNALKKFAEGGEVKGSEWGLNLNW